jgi:hypothetical protein
MTVVAWARPMRHPLNLDNWLGASPGLTVVDDFLDNEGNT